MPQPPFKTFSIPSTLGDAVHAQQQVLAEAQAHGFDDSARFALRLALDEALSNAVNHGNQNDPTKHVHIRYAITDEEATISVEDEGPGFKPEKIPDPTLDENLERPHGRGVMLMKAYMTRISFNKRGNCVTMVKNKSQEPRARSQ
jgi:serine/threonine-protein kinase RsbW